MDPLLQFLLVLTIVIATAKGGGCPSSRRGQPAVLGELLIGVILGPAVLDMLRWPLFTDQYQQNLFRGAGHRRQGIGGVDNQRFDFAQPVIHLMGGRQGVAEQDTAHGNED
jgi:Kef-type K+ transport system membrane component KefB